MFHPLTVTGMVLSSMPVGEYDKRLTILTKERGKISAFAKGARKPNSAFLACSQPFSFGEFTLAQGRSSYTVTGVEISNYFAELRNHPSFIWYGMYFAEFTDYYTREGNDEREVLKLLYQSLRALSSKSIGTELVRYIFELKLITINGEGPQVFECVSCGSKEMERFCAKSGGMVCPLCRGKAGDSLPLSSSTLYSLQYIVSSPVEKLFQFTVSEEVLLELSRIVGAYRREYVQHTMKSLEMLDELQ